MSIRTLGGGRLFAISGRNARGIVRSKRVAVAVALCGASTVLHGTAGAAVPTELAVIATIRVGQYPDGVAVDPSTHNVYVVNSGASSNRAGTVSVIDESGDANNGRVV